MRDYFEDQAGIPISKGSIANFNVEASQRLDKFEDWAKKQLIEASLNHADETGINVGGKKIWLQQIPKLARHQTGKNILQFMRLSEVFYRLVKVTAGYTVSSNIK